MNLAVWSGPRNLSTALMYSFAQRADCQIWDEPFYAAYLARTGLDHPMRAQILAANDADYGSIITACTAPSDGLHYQKHMCQHLAAEDDLAWLSALTNVLLIRHPARVIASYHAKRENPIVSDLGLDVQAQIYARLSAQGETPIVIDATDIRANPEGMLRALCARLDISFDPKMLHWPKGGHKDDGVWAPHWYGAVWNSTGFSGAEGPVPKVPDELVPILKDCLHHYQRLAEVKISV
ncbi:MAG: HAD family hydrolase [Pseudomonadota bacterium]